MINIIINIIFTNNDNSNNKNNDNKYIITILILV